MPGYLQIVANHTILLELWVCIGSCLGIIFVTPTTWLFKTVPTCGCWLCTIIVSLIGSNGAGKSTLLNNLQGQLLHAETLEFVHPTKNKWIKFKSEIPKDFKKMQSFLEKVHGWKIWLSI